MVRLRASLLGLSFVSLGLACSLPPDRGDVGVAQLALVSDSYLFELGVTQVVKVFVLRASTASGGLSCSDLRGSRFNTENPQFEQLVEPTPAVSLAKHDPSKEVVFDLIQVPADQPVVFVVRGLSQYGGGVFSVGEGCKGSLLFKAGESKPVDIDMTASTGADCSAAGDCQTGLGCQLTGEAQSAFWGGYCAKSGCGGDQDCPPGSRCISNGAAENLCLRGCRTPSDCTYLGGGAQSVQDCVGRTGPTASGCAAVCVYPLWNKTSECTP